MSAPLPAKAGLRIRSFLFLCFAASLAVWACRINQDEPADYKFSFTKLYDSLSQFDSVTLVLKNAEGAVVDTLFKGKVDGKSKIENLDAPHYHGGKINIDVTGFMAGKVAFRVEKKYDGATGKTDSTISVILRSTVLTYAGGPLQFKEGDSAPFPKITVSPDNLADKALQWTSSDTKVLAVESDQIRARGAGVANLSASLVSDPAKAVVIAVTVAAKTPPDTVRPPIDTARAPLAPSISSVNSGDAKVTLTWSAVAGAESYNIYYGEGSGVDKGSTRIKGVTSPYEVLGLKNGALYGFSLSAVNKAGESDLGAVKTATPMAPAASAPIIASANAGNKKVVLSWGTVSGATSYNVYYTAGGTVDKTGTKVADAASPYEVGGLVNGANYAFAVTAVSPGGESGLSNIASATPQEPAPGAPALSSASAGNAKVTVAWAAVPGAASYNLYYTAGASVDKGGTLVSGVSSPFDVTGLINGTAYAFAVAAVSPGGESGLSNVLSATPQVPAPGAPVLGSANAGDANVTLTWAAVPGATSYTLYYKSGATVDKTGLKITDITSPYLVQSLANGTAYAFAVSAMNAGGESGLSNALSATPQAPAPGAPVLGSVSAGDAVATVTWASVSGATSYDLYYKAGTTVDKTGTKVAGAASPAQVAGLTNGTTYAFAVAAVSAGGESALSNIGTATPQVPTPAAPILGSASAGDAKVTLTWAAVTGATSYKLYYKSGTTVDKSVTPISPVTSPYQVLSLANGTGYAFAVSAVNAGGESALSNIATATPQVPVPAAPILGSASAGDAKVTLTWAGVSGAASYNLYYKAGTTVDKTGTKVTGAASPAQVTGLANGTGYAFAVSAVSAGGESGLSNVVTATPLAIPPAPTFSLSVPAYSQNAKPTWSWSALSDTSNKFVFKLNSNDLSTGTSTSKTASYQPASNLSEGNQTLYLVEENIAGTRSGVVSRSIFVDLTPPQATLTGLNPRTVDSYTVPLSGTVQDGGSGVDYVNISGAASGNGHASITGTAWSQTVTVNSGSTPITISAYDKSGRVSTINLPVSFTPFTKTWLMTDSAMGHEVGAANGTIWEAGSAGSKFITYGPYYDLPANKNYRVDFKLAYSGTVSPGAGICTIDVATGTGGIPDIPVALTLYDSDFTGQDVFKTFSLSIPSSSTTIPSVQFRVRYYSGGTHLLREDATTVTEVP